MQITVHLEDAVRRAALVQGRELPATITISIDLGTLPEELRVAAAPHLPLDGGALTVWRPNTYVPWSSPVDANDFQAVLNAWLSARLAGEQARSAHEAKIAAMTAQEEATADARARARAEEVLSKGAAGLTRLSHSEPIRYGGKDAEVRDLVDRANAVIETARKSWREDEARADEEKRARAAAEKAAAEAEKQTWVEEHGSEHLRKALCAGYDCQRLYVTERAAKEFPGFTVDFGDDARWDNRSCPSEEALAISLGVPTSRVVWLTAPARKLRGMEAEDWESREAVVVEDWLGKYDLVREV